MAGYFDWQHRFADDCLVDNPDTESITNACLLIPRSPEDLDKRHRSFERLARYSWGMLGRTPDYVQTVLSGFAARDDKFCRRRRLTVRRTGPATITGTSRRTTCL